ncbi:MAG: sodium-translocating pyrophosphatase [Deltaproteobacteria bacterium]|nr:sodium-translocating pyrophosphatase [Deltaproteobacteria bacterium]
MVLLSYLIPAAGLLALLFAFWRTRWIKKQPAGSDRMKEISGFIRQGAMAFLAREYKVIAVFVVVVSAGLALANELSGDASWWVAVAFAGGAFCSALSGYFGMNVATMANVRTAHAAETGLNKALGVAFSGGAVMGMCVVGLGVLGLGLFFLLFKSMFGVSVGDPKTGIGAVISAISGFSLGASSIALFARVGGGIYTKAADVGADLVGKVEAGIPEDDPRNPAVIADLVGDNVGDVAGMGADLFESYVGAIVSTMVLGAVWIKPLSYSNPDYQFNLVLLPMILAGVGIICSILGTFFVRTKEGGNPQAALNMGMITADILMVGASYGVIRWLVPMQVAGEEGILLDANRLFYATVLGLAVGVAVGFITEYYTAEGRGPARKIAAAAQMGAATNIIKGLATGMLSTAFPLILIAVATYGAYYFAGLYGIALAGLGMLATTGIQLAVDAYGPIADNSGGIAEMSDLPKEVRGRTDKLDAVGNTTAAIGKGFAIGSAALTALALFAAFRTQVGVGEISITDPMTVAGLFVGGMLPFLFASFAMNAVGEAAQFMIVEVRRQFKEIAGLLEGKEGVKADYARCVDISTRAAIRKMIVLGMLAVISPLVVGLIDLRALTGLLAGATVTGVLMAIFMANAGGAWDNAKKHIEGGAFGGKGSVAHKAAVVGDTVGDPFKDTAGPSMNILIKLMSVFALVLAPLLKAFHGI